MRGILIGIVAGTVLLSVYARGQLGLSYTNSMGDELIDRPLNNALAGQVAIYCGPSFKDFGLIDLWYYYDNDTSGRAVTPIIFQRLNETDFRVFALGAARQGAGVGVHSARFDLEMGFYELIGPGYTFGFAERLLFDPEVTPTPPGCAGEASRSTGIVDYEISPTGQWAHTTNENFYICLGQIFRIGGVLSNNVVPLVRDPDAPRTYSARLTAKLIDSPLSLTIFTNGDICWSSRTNRQYQIQWAPQMETNTVWHNLGTIIPGNGGTNCVQASFQEADQRFYRALITRAAP